MVMPSRLKLSISVEGTVLAVFAPTYAGEVLREDFLKPLGHE